MATKSKSAAPLKRPYRQSRRLYPPQLDEISQIVKILKLGSEVTTSGCWLWKGPFRADGYPFIHRKELLRLSGLDYRHEYRMLHKLAVFTHCGDFAWVAFACHSCDVHHCVNPDHVWPGSHADNMEDASKKGRVRATRAKLFGADNPFFGRKHSEESLNKMAASSKLVDWNKVLGKAWETRRAKRKGL